MKISKANEKSEAILNNSKLPELFQSKTINRNVMDKIQAGKGIYPGPTDIKNFVTKGT